MGLQREGIARPFVLARGDGCDAAALVGSIMGSFNLEISSLK
jgi:hypothetical protein